MPHRDSGGVRTRNPWNGATHRGMLYSGAIPSRTTFTMASATRSGVNVSNRGWPRSGKPSVGTNPGLTDVTRTRFGPIDTFSDSLKATTAYFVGVFSAAPGEAVSLG